MLRTPSSAVGLLLTVNAAWLALIPALMVAAARRESTAEFAAWDWDLLTGLVLGSAPLVSGIAVPFVAPLDRRVYLFVSTARCPLGAKVLAAFAYLVAGGLLVSSYTLAAAGWGEVAVVTSLWAWVAAACRASVVHGARREYMGAAI